jgi:DNA-directed RNA polymerase specialized sigma24 family protein
MDGMTTPKIKWELTREALAKFLASLDPDTERAGGKYEALREALVKFFQWRRALFPEELADEALNRVIRKVDEGEAPRDVPTYCHGVARMVLLETLKRPENKRADLEEIESLATLAPDVHDEDERQSCFDGCLRELPVENRRLIMRYYQDERRRKIENRLALAEELGIDVTALRNRALRIRDKLDKCVTRCLKKNNFRAI